MTATAFPIVFRSRGGDATRVEATEGDLAEQRVDAIVCPVNTFLDFNGGVIQHIAARAGDSGRALQNDALSHGPIKIGQAVLFDVEGLGASRVILAATVDGPLDQSSPRAVRRSIESALKCADARQLNSLAFPAMGTGTGAVTYRDCAEITLGEIRRYVEGSDPTTNLRHLVLVAWGKDPNGFLPALERAASALAHRSSASNP